jgi:chromosome partitioning protein
MILDSVMPLKITFLNQKGGVGKSTSSVLVGAALSSAGYNVAFEDQDSQGSLSMWAAKIGKMPMVHECATPEVIICDTPGRIDLNAEEHQGFFRSIILSSDRLVIVSEKSLFSTQASIPMIEMVKRWMPPESKAMILFNKVRTRTLVGRQDEGEMGQDLGLPVLKNSLPLAAAYENIQVQGFPVVSGKYRERIFSLALEIVK